MHPQISPSIFQSAAAAARKIAAVLFGLLIALLLIELILHVYNPFQFRVKGNQIVLPLNKRSVIQNDRVQKLDPLIVHTTNSLGFRGAEPPGVVQDKFLPLVFDDYLTILAVGGSTTECYFLTDGMTWPELLGDLIQREIPRSWMNNAGFVGHTTFGHLILLRDVIAPLHPDVVLFLTGLNDVGIMNYSQTYDAQIMSGGKFRPGTDDSPNMQPAPARLCFSSAACFATSLADFSETANLALNLYRNYRAAQTVPGHASPSLTVGGDIDEIQEDLLAYTHRREDNVEGILAAVKADKKESLRGYEERLRLLITESRAAGIEPVLITQPVLYGEGVDDITGVNLETIEIDSDRNGLVKWRILEIYNDIARRLGEQEDVLVIDLARTMPKSSRYYYDFVHFTNEGSRKVAEILAAELIPYLKSRPWKAGN